MSGEHHHHADSRHHSFDSVASTLTEAMASSPAFFDQINSTAFDRASFDRIPASTASASVSLSPASLLASSHHQQQQHLYNQHIQHHQHHLPIFNPTSTLLQHHPLPQLLQQQLQQQQQQPVMVTSVGPPSSSSSTSTSASSTSSSKHARSSDDDTASSEKDSSSIDPSESRQSKRSKNVAVAAANTNHIGDAVLVHPPIDQLIPAGTTVSDKITPLTSHGTPSLLSTTTSTTTVLQDQSTPSLASTPSSSTSSSTSSLQQQQPSSAGQPGTETQAKSTPTATVNPEAARPLCFGMIQSLVVTLYPRHLEFEEGKSDPVLIRRATTANKASLAVEHEAGLVSSLVSSGTFSSLFSAVYLFVCIEVQAHGTDVILCFCACICVLSNRKFLS
ncbi:MAG: hypothetical protein JOS17DRAFT_443645 [Linnemannia elongata]|nr:MAG: hypothetical protein JOS17DRAFT_443645 [Linnemannia elongata]